MKTDKARHAPLPDQRQRAFSRGMAPAAMRFGLFRREHRIVDHKISALRERHQGIARLGTAFKIGRIQKPAPRVIEPESRAPPRVIQRPRANRDCPRLKRGADSMGVKGHVPHQEIGADREIWRGKQPFQNVLQRHISAERGMDGDTAPPRRRMEEIRQPHQVIMMEMAQKKVELVEPGLHEKPLSIAMREIHADLLEHTEGE